MDEVTVCCVTQSYRVHNIVSKDQCSSLSSNYTLVGVLLWQMWRIGQLYNYIPNFYWTFIYLFIYLLVKENLSSLYCCCYKRACNWQAISISNLLDPGQRIPRKEFPGKELTLSHWIPFVNTVKWTQEKQHSFFKMFVTSVFLSSNAADTCLLPSFPTGQLQSCLTDIFFPLLNSYQ